MRKKSPHRRNTSGLKAHAQQRAQEAHRRAMEAIDRLFLDGQPVNFNTVSESSGVSKGFLYKQPDVKERIETLRVQGRAHLRLVSGPEEVERTDKSRDVLLAAKDQYIQELKEKMKGLQEEVNRLKQELKIVRGQIYENLPRRQSS